MNMKQLVSLWYGGIIIAAIIGIKAFDGSSSPMASEERKLLIAGVDAGYVDQTLCAGCHTAIAERYSHTGMGRSFFRLRPENRVEDFAKNNALYHKLSDRHYLVYQQNGIFYQRRHQIDFNGREFNIVEKEIHFVIGSGNHARSYLHRTPQGRLVQLPLSWYADKGGYWEMSPGYNRPDHMGFRREVNHECMSCHNGYPEIEPGSDSFGSRPIFPGKIPEGIDCSRCHGPGRDHILALQRGESAEMVRRSIVNPARLSAERQLEVCMQCHLETTSRPLPHALWRYHSGRFSYRPGEPLENYILHFDHSPGTGYDAKFEVVNSVYRLRKSACFRESNGAMTCTTCHNAHDVPRGERAARHYVQVCQTCHGEALGRLIEDKRHPESQQCLPCHMPKRRTEDVVHVVMTDHNIQRWKPDRNPMASLQEVHDDEENPYQGEVVLYYPPELPRTPVNELYLAVAQVKDRANLGDGIRRLERAIRRHRPERGEFYFELAEAYRNTEQIERAITMYEAALDHKPGFLPALANLGLALSTSDHLLRAVEVLGTASSIAPNDYGVLNTLGEAYYRLGRLDESIVTLRKAVIVNPDWAEAYINLGAALLARGERPAAELQFRSAVQVQPDFADAHHNLANVLPPEGDFHEAKYHFEKAIQFAPNRTATRHKYAMALMKKGLLDEAQWQLEAALRVDSKLADVQNNLGTLLAKKGDLEGAIQHYNFAISANPKFAMAHFNLGVAFTKQGKHSDAKKHLLAAVEWDSGHFKAHFKLGEVLALEGQRAQAIFHFNQAARSPDSAIRNAAIESLDALAPGPLKTTESSP